MCPESAPRTEDLEVHVIGDNQGLVESMVAALSNGQWTNIPTIRSLKLSETAYRMDVEEQGRVRARVRVAGFDASRAGAGTATAATAARRGGTCSQSQPSSPAAATL
jgi:hypothetical protein